MLKDYSFLCAHLSTVIAIGPEIYDKETLSAYKSYGENDTIMNSFVVVPTLISSGTLIPIDAFDKVGLMEEKLFIDYVDHEWCWRAFSKGYICCMDRNVRIMHKVGQKAISLCGFPFLISSSFRYFYQYRNSLWLMKRYYVPFNWKVKTLLRNLVSFFFIPWYSSTPWNTIKSMIKGIFAGIKLGK